MTRIFSCVSSQLACVAEFLAAPDKECLVVVDHADTYERVTEFFKDRPGIVYYSSDGIRTTRWTSARVKLIVFRDFIDLTAQGLLADFGDRCEAVYFENIK